MRGGAFPAIGIAERSQAGVEFFASREQIKFRLQSFRVGAGTAQRLMLLGNMVV